MADTKKEGIVHSPKRLRRQELELLVDGDDYAEKKAELKRDPVTELCDRVKALLDKIEEAEAEEAGDG